MKGPKAILAEAIANALAEYFVIDPALIETNLISNAGVTLHEVQLRPLVEQRINDKVCADITGKVATVAFHWKWGSSKTEERNGGSSWVNSAELTIDGLKFSATLKEFDTCATCTTQEQQATDPPVEKTTQQTDKTTTTKNGGFLSSYVQNQVERIIDTLRLSITDFEFTLSLPPKPDGSVTSLAFGGAGVNLDSHGRASEMESLRQQVSIANIFASIIAVSKNNNNNNNAVEDKQDDKIVHPLLEPVSYQATSIRAAGKRFGLQRGLRVKGLSMDHGINVHTGQPQFFFLNDLAGLLLAAPSSTTTTPPSPPPPPTTTTNDHQDEKENEETIDQDKDSFRQSLDVTQQQQESNMPSSFFELPLAALALIFPNGTKISMADLVVKYQLDGTICLVQGHTGFLVNDFAMLSLGDEGLWQANVVDATFRVLVPDHAKTTDDETDAYIHARDNEIKNIINGVHDLLEIYQVMLNESSGAVASLASNPDILSSDESSKQAAPRQELPSTESTSTWTFDIDGGVNFLLEGPNDDKIVECQLSRIHAAMEAKTLTIGSVKTLDIPGTICLTQPLTGTAIKFDGSLFDIALGDFVVKLYEPPPIEDIESTTPSLDPSVSGLSTSSSASSEVSEVDERPPIVLPFGVKAEISSVKVYQSDGETLHTTLKTIQAALGPDSPDLKGDEKVHSGGVRTVVLMEEMNHDMIALAEPKLSAVLYPHNPNLVQEFHFGAKNMAVAAGYSVLDWRRLFETGDEKRETKQTHKMAKKPDKKEKVGAKIRLPFAHVDPLKVRIVLKGDIVGTKGTTINIKAFDGKEGTLLHDLIAFYTRRAASSFPGMFKDIEFLGFNVTDAAANHIGTVAGAGMGAVGGAALPVAGVLGIVGFDGIKNAIKAGKQSRGAEEDDKTNFTDFFVGIGQAAKDATANGAVKRGKTNQEKADALDWAVGATSGTLQYTNENKSRLAGAGAGTVGFTAGFLFGGPVGAVAGAIIASKATSTTVDAVDAKFSKMKKNKEKPVGPIS